MATVRIQDNFKFFYTQAAAHVLMPVYNAEDYIVAAIQSVFKQSYNNVTLFIFGDGCTDNTIAKIQTFQKDNPDLGKHIYLLYNTENRGVEYARSALLNWSKETNPGAYLFWLDSDDQYIYNDFIKAAITQMQVTGADICLFNFAITFQHESQKRNAAGLLKDRDNSIEVLKAIMQHEGQAIVPALFTDLLKFTSVGCAKCYSPRIALPAPLNCPFEDFVYMAALLMANKVTALSPDIMPVEYLRRSDSICGKRKPTHFTHDIPAQLARFFDVVFHVVAGKSDDDKKILLQMAKDFVQRKVDQYTMTIANLLADHYEGFSETTQAEYANQAKVLVEYVDAKIESRVGFGCK